MAKKPPPGKKFKYDLQSVLKVRAIREKQEQEKFSEKQREFLTEKEKEDQIRDDKLNSETDLRQVFTKPVTDMGKILSRKAHLDVLKSDLEKQIEKVIESSRKLEEQRARLIDSMKDKKVMEKHKERKLKEYGKMMLDLEQKFMDEIATERFKQDKRD
ncbi:flagellar export protein FliJ [Candidatus Saganbacteria bacterium CG08_land_8_20_14_0_20_45_16]|uniref:Flagellar FliJ protein n=1 Tax=Candidatus Saganbacteria bacterium CG08_land_8_20_14_0_20_45_16 TaxID=2014293 RepID=A0A2H0XYD9_UNCSA|nr:MAG: flagellar export protein FliJ [Candidatus Saganbacteria bacterium CG08_land_8_20_14_0_20_45_16]